MSWFLGILILWTSFWDGWRDTGIRRTVDRDKWHYVKWMAWFPSQLFLTYWMLGLTGWPIILGMAGASWLFWQAGHNLSPWEPKQ